jgi:hypothetical protein
VSTLHLCGRYMPLRCAQNANSQKLIGRAKKNKKKCEKSKNKKNCEESFFCLFVNSHTFFCFGWLRF